MAKISGVPTLDPVSLPSISPEQAGRGFGAVAQLGEEANDIAQTGLGFDLFLKKAQEHVDSLAAQNQLAKVYADTQNQLAKTQNSRDVDGVIQQSTKTLNDLSAEWSKSPAAISIQMSADALRPDLSRIGTVRQVDLMTKEDKINRAHQFEVLGSSYATDRASGGSGDAALGAYANALKGSVDTGLLGSVEAEDDLRKFKQSGQIGQINLGIKNSNPQVNSKIMEDIEQHRDQFPDVTDEQLAVLKGQAMDAFESHTKKEEWAKGQIALQRDLPAKLNQFTNPATGLFDEGAAMADNAKRLTDGQIDETQSRVLAEAFSSHASQLHVGLKQEADKRKDGIEKKLAAHDFSGASQDLEASQDWFEQRGFSNDYQGLLRYTDQAKREVRAEAASARSANLYERTLNRQEAEENSKETLANVQALIGQGYSITYPELQNMAGEGKGKMKTSDVNAAWAEMQKMQSQPDFASAVKYIHDAFPEPGTKEHPANADQIGAAKRKYADTFDAFNAEVNANPTKSKAQIARDVVKSAQEQQIKDHADAMFGTTPSVPLTTRLGKFLFGGASDDLKKGADAAGKAIADIDKPKPPANPVKGDKFNGFTWNGNGWVK